jgi:acetyl-CoA carboxylase carboxyl transferase subunit alpha
MVTLEFEKHISAVEKKIDELRHMSKADGVSIVEEISKLQSKVDKLLKEKYDKLSSWEKVLVARHPERPHFLNYIGSLIEDFIELSGDRSFSEDAAIVAGFGKFRGQPVLIMGHEKGNDTTSRVKHNFGMPKPEGYRKAQRLMKLADHYGLPIITLVDTAGAYPGIDAEERGQSEAIARSIEVCLSVKVPLITIVIGEGGSGGAIAIAAANRILMLEHAIYSVISPEGCASILWRSADKKQEAAEAQKLTAQDLLKLKVIDGIIKEPLGGAHRDHKEAIKRLGDTLEKELEKLLTVSPQDLMSQRQKKFLDMGRVS